MKSIIFLAVFVAFACAQYMPQYPVNPIQLSNGVAMSGKLTAAAQYPMQEYYIYIPANASMINITINNLNSTACYYLEHSFRVDGGACYQSNYAYNNFYCGNGANDYWSGLHNYQYWPGQTDGLFEFKAGDNLFIAVSSYYSTTSNSGLCSYTVEVDYQTCPSGQIGVATSSSPSSPMCSAYTQVNNSAASTVNVVGTGTGYQGYWVMDVLPNTGYILVQFNVTSVNTVYLYGSQYSANNYNSYCSSSVSDGFTSFYCYAPRSGQFVFAIAEDDYFNGTISFFPFVCPTGMGGYNCSWPVSALNTSYLTAGGSIQLFIPYISCGSNDCNQVIYYVDVPMNYTGNDFLLSAISPASTGSAYLTTRINGFPSVSSSYNEISYESQSIGSSTPARWGLTQLDYLFPGRYYFAIVCYSGSVGCNVTIAANASSGTSGSSSTTGSASGGSTTGLTTATTTGSTTALTTATTTGSTTALTTAVTPTTGITTKSNTTLTTGRTTGVTSTSTTTTSGALTSTTGGVEMIIPSVFLLLVALLF